MNIVRGNEEEIADLLSERVIELVSEKPDAVLGLATGSSPILTYQYIVRKAKSRGVSFKKVKTFNLDEYVDLKDESKSYKTFMFENLFSHLDIDLGNTHFPSEENPLDYDYLISTCSGIDLQILGIGRDGHIGFNEPFTPFDSLTHVTDLEECTREDNSRFFSSLAIVPSQAVTMGLKTIMQAKEIAVIALGKNKREAVSAMLKKQDISCPASILNSHEYATLYVDDDAFDFRRRVF